VAERRRVNDEAPLEDPGSRAGSVLGRLADVGPSVGPPATPVDADRAWAASGAMSLTGPTEEAWLAPTGVVDRVLSLGRLLDTVSVAVAGHRLDPLALLAERAALSDAARHGRTSCGRATRLLGAADGWLAVSLARPDDVAALAAWLETPVSTGAAEPPWDEIARVVADRPIGPLVDQATRLGLPVAALDSVGPDRPAVVAEPLDGPDARPLDPSDTLVVDLSSLWAGPLCTHLLGLAGATVVKVESSRRPDGARLGPSAFFDLLHAGQRSVALDLSTEAGRTVLRRLLGRADVVVEASRPRALEQMGLGPRAVMAGGRTRAWVSITGYGRTGDGANRVAFGDDAAVAGGLVARAGPGEGPWFCADAVADPLTGMAAAAAVLTALASGRHWLLDVALARVAAVIDRAGPDGTDGWRPARDRPDLVAGPARARRVAGSAPTLGADTASVMGWLEAGVRGGPTPPRGGNL
jgi:hypothetical protein